MNKKQIDKMIVGLKELTKGTLPIIQIVETDADKKLMLKSLKGKRGVKNITVRSREEHDGIQRRIKEEIKKDTKSRIAKLERAESRLAITRVSALF